MVSMSYVLALTAMTGGALLFTTWFQWRISRAAARALDDARARLATLESTADVAVWEIDLQTREIWSTQNYARLAGLREGTQPSRVAAAAVMHPDDRAATLAQCAEAASHGTPVDSEYRVIDPSGGIRWIRRRGRVIRDGGGTPVKLRGVLLDVTASRLAEARAQEQRQQLAHLGRVSMLGEMAGTLAHELTQPLTAIRANIETARRLLHDDASAPAEQIDDLLLEIQRDDQRAGAVIHRLRTLLRKSDPQRQEMDVAAAVHDVLAIARADLVSRDIRVSMILAANLPLVLADRVQVQQVVLNLVLNAADAMYSRPPDARHLTISTSAANGQVFLEVSDTGTGVPADRLQRIFEPFETTKGSGLGLGLSICRSIVGDHGGALWAENNAGHGATFIVRLPAARVRERVADSVVVPGDIASGSRNTAALRPYVERRVTPT